MDLNEQKEKVNRTKEYVYEVFSKTDKAHDFGHIIRVYRNAREILKRENADAFIVLMAALLHDIADAKLFSPKPDEEALLKSIDPLKDVDPLLIKQIIQVINEVPFSKQIAASTIESAIVQDADRLDAIGAIGIARAFTYGGSIGRPIYSKDKESTVKHFYDKLLRLPETMNTDSGREIAKQRHEVMIEFLNNLFNEIGENDEASSLR